MSRIVVVKLGGHALEASASLDEALETLADGLRSLQDSGVSPIVVHGAGPQISDLLTQLGLTSTSIDGLRVTDGATMNVVAMALSLINLRIVAGLNHRKILAKGLAGPDANFLVARAKGETWGRVGHDISVDSSVVMELIAQGAVPVVNPVAVDIDGSFLNCNADAVAGAIAAGTKAEALILLSDVDQIRSIENDPRTALATVTRHDIDVMIESGAISGGMLPKVSAALHALDAGATRVVLTSGTRSNSLIDVLAHVGPSTEVTV